MFRDAIKGEPGRPGKGCESQPNKTAKGTGNKAYTCERLSKVAPELFEEVKAGRMSANAAAIQAGIRKKPSPLNARPSITCSDPKSDYPLYP